MKTNNPSGTPLAILLVEDNQSHSQLIMRSFEDNRVANTIHLVTDGEAALQYIFRQGPYADPQRSPRPHVILLDLRLPKIDGLEVLRRIKSTPEFNMIPIIILTTSEAESDVAAAYRNHANSYLVKPVDFPKFTKLMRDLGFYWLGWNINPWS